MSLPGYPQYYEEGRASGSYFCPDHFSGIMELSICLCIGILFARRSSQGWRIIAGFTALVARLPGPSWLYYLGMGLVHHGVNPSVVLRLQT